jgi:hypothetical protein
VNTETGEVVRNIEDVPPEQRPRFTAVPKHLRAAALAALGEEMRAQVDLNSDHPLAKWARKQNAKAYSERHNFRLQTTASAERAKAKAEAKRQRRRERNQVEG